MSWLGRLFRSSREPETKAVDFSAEMWSAINGGWGIPTSSGASISISSALGITAFYRGGVVLADGIAQLPVQIYRRNKDGKGSSPAIDHPLYDLLLNEPSGNQDSAGYWTSVVMHAALGGRSVSYRNEVNGILRELIPIRPEMVEISLDSIGRQVFDVSFETGHTARLYKEQVFVVFGPSWNGYKGIDPTVIGREALGLARATEETHARLHANGVKPSGVLTTEQQLSPDMVRELQKGWQESYGGTNNVGKTPVMTNGLKWSPTAQTGVDSEHLDTRKHQIEEIARLLGLFPIMLGHAGDQSPTFASAEAFMGAHVRYSLQPWINRVCKAVDTQLLTKAEREDGYHCRIDSSELLRGSLKDRAEYYRSALGSNSNPGWLRPNEVREDDGWDPDPEEAMDKVWQPLSMQPAGTPAQDPAAPAQDQATPPEAKSSAPRTLYVSRKLINGAELVRWARSQGFVSAKAPEKLHVTIAYSRARLDWMKIDECWGIDGRNELVIPAGGARVVELVGKDHELVALKFRSAALAYRNEVIREAGASWDWPNYQPHITFALASDGVDLKGVTAFNGELRFGPEIFEEIQEL